jgi:hypothetical protein
MTKRELKIVLATTGGMAALIGGLVFLVFLPMCSNKLDGAASVYGKPFAPTSCHSGQRWNFVGVELEADDGRRLRVAQTTSGGGDVYVFDAYQDRGDQLGECATLDVERQHSTINDITNVEGRVAFACKTDRGEVTGTVSFENCH